MRDRLRRMLRALALPLVATGMVACASGGGGSGNSGDATFLVVENNLSIPTTLTVYAVPQSGVRMLVGSVRPNSTARLRFSPVSGQQYRFVAETASGSEVTSNPVTVIRGTTVEWNVNGNIATAIPPG